MTFRFGAKPAALMPDTPATSQELAVATRKLEAEAAVVESVVDRPMEPDYIPPVESDEDVIEGMTAGNKLSRLIDDDFPFDESQLDAINGIANQQYACLTGAAGTGKTTSTKAIVDKIMDSLGSVDMATYFKTKEGKKVDVQEDEEDPSDLEEKIVPAIALVGFTGRSSQMIKKNFPRDWHGNIMTIHRMLGFYPEYFPDWDEESGTMRNKMRFVPLYTAHFKLPWDVIVIDEAGMLSVDLWDMVWAAAKEGCRIIMIGDINQLPPVHGRSIFGFAMTKWPSWELTHIHRQAGVNNSIVDNAWNILKGIKPTSDEFQSDPGWKFAMMPIPEDSALASRKIRGWLANMAGKAYHPNRDSVITAINGQDASNGYALGQIPMNRELAVALNKGAPRFIIDAGRERKQFAVGDKVMATKNDHEVGITNGMTGIITSIEANAQYAGDHRRFGLVSEVSKYLADQDDEDDEDFSLEDLADSMAAQSQGKANAKEAKERGPASHVVTVRFGDGEHSFEIPFGSLSEVASLMTAYVVTCHKMQGGESPLVVIICHQAHRQMLNREWLYTAVTRASKKCVLFFTDQGLRIALNKQRIKGSTLAEKVRVFNELSAEGVVGGKSMGGVNLAEPVSLNKDLVTSAPRTMMEQVPTREQANEVNTAKLQALLGKAVKRQESKPDVHVHVVDRSTHHHHYHVTPPPPPAAPPAHKDGGILTPMQSKQRLEANLAAIDAQMSARKPLASLSAPTRRWLKPVGPVVTVEQATRPEPLRLTYQPLTKAEQHARNYGMGWPKIQQQSCEGPKPAAKVPFRFGSKK